MADEDDEQNQDDSPEPEQRLFTLTEAERARKELEPFLVEAMDCRKKLAGLETDLTAVSARITMMGGVIVPYEKLATLRVEHQQLAETLKSALDRILETGCVIKDLEVGLLDFPALLNKISRQPKRCVFTLRALAKIRSLPLAEGEFACRHNLRIGSRIRLALICVLPPTNPSIGMNGVTPLSRAPNQRTSRCCWISERCGATGAM